MFFMICYWIILDYYVDDISLGHNKDVWILEGPRFAACWPCLAAFWDVGHLSTRRCQLCSQDAKKIPSQVAP